MQAIGPVDPWIAPKHDNQMLIANILHENYIGAFTVSVKCSEIRPSPCGLTPSKRLCNLSSLEKLTDELGACSRLCVGRSVRVDF